MWVIKRNSETNIWDSTESNYNPLPRQHKHIERLWFHPKNKKEQTATGQSIQFTQCQAGDLQSLNANSFKMSSCTSRAMATVFLVVFSW